MKKLHMRGAILWVLLVAIGGIQAVRATDEAIAFGIDDFSGWNACIGDPDFDLSHSIDMAEAFDDAFDDWEAEGRWDISQIYRDTAVDDRDWVDGDFAAEPWGADDDEMYGADHADVAMISTHGSSSSSGSTPYSEIEMGDDDNETCTPTTNQMKFGDGGSGNDMEIAIIAACQSAQLPVYEGHGYDTLDGESLNTWLGFHGDSLDSSSDVNHFEDFVKDSRVNGLGDNWVDEMYRNNVWIGNVVTGWEIRDECPAAVIFAESEAKCDLVHDYGGFSDRDKEGTHTLVCYYALDGCNPASGAAL